MAYLSVTEIAKKWNMSERSVRNYCAQGRIEGAFLTGKTWNIPENAEKPERTKRKSSKPETLLDILKREKDSKHHGGIYHKTQIDLTYNSNHIEGSRLTHDQTRYIFETNTIGIENEVVNVDDVINAIKSMPIEEFMSRFKASGNTFEDIYPNPDNEKLYAEMLRDEYLGDNSSLMTSQSIITEDIAEKTN